jgi:hypothetical protein
MSSDLIAWVVAVTLGIAVVVLGLRRNLSETTRSGLPRFGENPERATATLGLYGGEDRRRGSLSPRQRRWFVSFYLLIALTNAVLAVLSADDRLLHTSAAGLWMLGAVLLLRRASKIESEARD